MRVVVLGATGFLGASVCAELLSKTVETIAIGRSPMAAGLATRSIQVTDYRKIPSDLKGAACIHLATPGHLAPASSNSSADRGAESIATTEWLSRFGFSKIVFASSAAVYGDQLNRPAKESDPCVSTSEYAKLKISCERTLNLEEHAIARIANVYGFGMSKLNVLSDILTQLCGGSTGTDKIVLRDLSPVRDYVSVKDVARALGLMATGAFTGVLNIGSGQALSVREIANLMLQAFDRENVELVSLAKESRNSYLVLDTAKAATDLHWRAEYDTKKEFKRLKNEMLEKALL